VAPGHLLPHARAIVEATDASVIKARSMDTNQYATFPDINCFELYDIYTTAGIYLSYWDKEAFPDALAIFNHLIDIRIPLLWISGKDDPLTSLHAAVFQPLLGTSSSAFHVVEGNHLTVAARAAPMISEFAEKIWKNFDATYSG